VYVRGTRTLCRCLWDCHIEPFALWNARGCVTWNWIPFKYVRLGYIGLSVEYTRALRLRRALANPVRSTDGGYGFRHWNTDLSRIFFESHVYLQSVMIQWANRSRKETKNKTMACWGALISTPQYVKNLKGLVGLKGRSLLNEVFLQTKVLTTTKILESCRQIVRQESSQSPVFRGLEEW
jgi:hypothetical protein